MKALNLQEFGEKVVNKRGESGIRDTAKRIGISPSTLSRIERGFLPDLETFKVVCDWLEVNPGDILGSKASQHATSSATFVHFKKDKATTEKAAQELGRMIMYAQRAVDAQKRGA